MIPTKHGNAYRAVELIYRNSPGRSWRRLNGALQGALDAAITAHLSFDPDDFSAIIRNFNGGYWMGNSEGSTCGERCYSHAVDCGHAPACISFERYAGRPALLWSEDVKTPSRLRIGSEFTWKGAKLTVTNIMDGHLVACAYSRDRFRGSDRDHISIGDIERMADGKYRQVDVILGDPAGPVTVEFTAPVEDPYERKVARVVKITFEELAAVRKAFELARKEALKAISGAADLEALKVVEAKLAAKPADTWRRFDVEDIRKAAKDREEAFQVAADRALEEKEREERRKEMAYSYAADLEEWASGKPARQWFHDVRLRVRGNRVETSTGQSASLDSVRRVLPVVLRRRNSFGPVQNLMVDAFPVVEQSTEGVKVGCTLVPWGEVERLAGLVEGAR